MDTFIVTITRLGSGYLLLPLSVCIGFLLSRAGRSTEAVLLNLSLILTMASVHALKLIFRRPRPTITELLVPMPPDWSFPSAHTAQATAFFLSLTLIASRILPPFWANLVALISLLIMGIVGFSRVYLQVHFISDVLAGMALAVLIVLALQTIISLLPWLQEK